MDKTALGQNGLTTETVEKEKGELYKGPYIAALPTEGLAARANPCLAD